MREIVTIQVGQFSNFVGSHFWNFQDELLGLAGGPYGDPIFNTQCLDMDVLYRTGETQQGICTYTPRLLSVDVPGFLGCMSLQGALHNEPSLAPPSVGTWTGNVSVHTSELRKKNIFLQLLQNECQDHPSKIGNEDGKSEYKCCFTDSDAVESLDSSVQFWTDFSKVHFHPKSFFELDGLGVNAQNFENYGIGKDTLLGKLQSEEMNERLRFFVEECDHIQGIQFMVDDSGCYSFAAADFLENIADEYTNIPLLLFTIKGPETYMIPRSRKEMVVRKLYDAISFSRLSSLSTLIVPVGLPNLNSSKASKYLCMKSENLYHYSAVYASALHSISLPFRMELSHPTTYSPSVSGGMDVNDIIQLLTSQATQCPVAILDVSIPAPSLIGSQFEHSFLESLQPLTHEVAEGVEDSHSVESLTILGAFESGVKRASISKVMENMDCCYEKALRKPKVSHTSISLCPLPIPLPFPSIFGNAIGRDGELVTLKESHDVASIPMAARLRSSNAILPFLVNRLEYLHKYGIEGGEMIRSWGLEKDEVEDMEENLFKMVRGMDRSSETSWDSD